MITIWQTSQTSNYDMKCGHPNEYYTRTVGVIVYEEFVFMATHMKLLGLLRNSVSESINIITGLN